MKLRYLISTFLVLFYAYSTAATNAVFAIFATFAVAWCCIGSVLFGRWVWRHGRRQ